MSKRAWTYCSVAVAIAGLVALSIHRRYWPLPPPSQLEKHLAAAYNETALKLYAELRSEPGNIAISPYSINTAMAMALSGARGDTEAEMRTVLGHTLPREQVDTANAELLSRLGKQRTDLAMANALCLTEYGDTISSAYRDLLVKNYKAEVFAATDIQPINAWVEKKTQGKIQGLLDHLSKDSACVLLNAICFHGEWAGEFDKEKTRPADFHVSEDTTVSVPMMYRKGECGSFRSQDCQAISLPYKGSSVAMIIMLPREGIPLVDLESRLDTKMLQTMFRAFLYQHKETVYLPRFGLECTVDLIPHFQAMGLTLPFQWGPADFSGMVEKADDATQIHISQIRHKAYLEVDEEGTQAAAATAVGFAEKAAEGIPFRADRPFLFLLVERQTNAILFMGRVTNPLE